MRNDQEFNIKFVGLVEQHPCLYDNTRDDYHKHNIQEKAWSTIVKEIGGTNTIAGCKTRWKNLRGNYTRHLKHVKSVSSGATSTLRRPYYLSELMEFILPFTKSRPVKENVEFTKEDETSDASVEDVSIEEAESDKGELENVIYQMKWSVSDEEAEQEDVLAEKEATIIPVEIEKQEDIQETSVPPKKSKIVHQQRPDPFDVEADKKFLLSLLPDFQKMTDRQKRKFKIGIIKLSDQILCEPTEARSHLSLSSPNSYIADPKISLHPSPSTTPCIYTSPYVMEDTEEQLSS